MNVPGTRSPLSLQNERLNQQNGMANLSVHSIYGQPTSVDQPRDPQPEDQRALLDQAASGIYPNPLSLPLSLRNNFLNQHNGAAQSVEGLPVRISIPNMEARQSRNEIPLSAHMNGGIVSQGVGVEINQCTSLVNPMSFQNTQLNQEKLINHYNQGVPPQLNNQTPSVVAYYSLYRDQGDQESGNTFNQHEAPQGPPQNSQEFRNQGDQQSFGNAPFHGHNQHEVSQSSSHRNGLQLDNSKRVFILHFSDTINSLETNPVLKLAVCLTRMNVDVTVDLFKYDDPPDSWPIWYEQKIKDSNVVLCIITKNFYHQLTNGNYVLGNSVYNLMNGSRNIAFRAVFIDADKREMMEYIPPAMQGATSYSISSNRLTPNDEEFANLYAFLTGQNRVEKPPLDNGIVLTPKKSRFSHFSGGPAPAPNRNIQQQQQQQWQPWQQQGMMYRPAPPPQPSPAPAANPPDVSIVEQANFIFTLLGGDPTPIKSICSHNKMFMQLASKMTAEWEGLGRLLNVSEPDIYAIKMDNIHSVTEQAVQMFRQWLMKNGSKATLGGLTTAVYDSGPQYWNLLDTINNYAPQQ